MDAAATLALLLGKVVEGASTRDADTTRAVLEEAGRFASGILAPLGPKTDGMGCRLEAGRVRTAPGHTEAWRAYAEGGWAGLTAPEAAGGQAQSMALAAAVQELLDAADPAFGMLAINARCATRLLAQHGDAEQKATWLPQLAAGLWSATICISEPQAGSDVGRIRTRATERSDGTWRITGEKCWISYGDHDLTVRIGHFLLARADGAPLGTHGLSLFLVPDTLDGRTRNGVAAARLEEKLGLHGSPTCVLNFEDAVAFPIGQPGRGLPTLFAMIVSMRLGVASQGAAVAQAAAEVAERYAVDRGQGGDPAGPPVRIVNHAEVRRLLLAGRVRAEAARLLALETAATIDASDTGDGAAAARAGILLPLAKTLGAEAAFVNADAAIQVLGGAGYVKEWPVERMLRDARVFSIYEGTTGIQGLDLLQRRVLGRDGTAVLADLLGRLAPEPDLVEVVTSTAAALSKASARTQQVAAVPFLHMLGIAVSDGLLRRAGRNAGPLADRYSALAAFHGAEAGARCHHLAERMLRDDVDLGFERVFPGLGS